MKTVFDKEFKKFGHVVEGFDFTELLSTLEEKTPKPEAGVDYIPAVAVLEELPIFKDLQDRLFGGAPIEIGYCNGANTKMNCLEYHRGSEVCVAADDVIMLLAPLSEVTDGVIDSSKVEAFELPKGTGVLYYETSMHYAPSKKDGSYRTIIILPRTTNTELPDFTPVTFEDKLLRARNKWLIAHADAPEAKDGVFVGITGPNIDVTELS
ncbi:MAG: DUF4867 family protein [Lachnospiraceae bacterium]|jgi:hypothetical protein|nr:DUF4867 family protein [Lachnospiraceae bacterium]